MRSNSGLMNEADIYSILGGVCRWSSEISESCPKYNKSFDQEAIRSKLLDPDTILNTKSFDQEAILSNFGGRRVAQNTKFFDQEATLSNFGGRRVAQNDVLVEGFGIFGAILGSCGSS